MVNGSQFGYSAGHYYYCQYLKNEFEIRYVCYDRGFEKIGIDGVAVNYVAFEGGKIKRLLSFIKTATSVSKSFSPDVLFVVYFNLCFLLSLFCRHKLSVLDIRTGSLLADKRKRKLSNRLLTLQSKFFNKRIILSESLRLNLGIKRKNTLVLPLGSEVYFNGDHAYDQLHLLYVGVFDGRRIADTIQGLGDYLQRFPDRASTTRYTLVGFGSTEEEQLLENLVNSLNLNSVVSFEGRKNYTEFEPYFKSANIGVSYIPVTDYYNLQPPTKTFEYILSGLFTIATGTFENKRLINKINGLICDDTAQSFSEVLDKCFELRRDLNSANIRMTLKAYEWSNIVNHQLQPFLI